MGVCSSSTNKNKYHENKQDQKLRKQETTYNGKYNFTNKHTLNFNRRKG